MQFTASNTASCIKYKQTAILGYIQSCYN